MSIALILLLVGGCLIAGLILLRKWALEKADVDIEHESLNKRKFNQLKFRQKIILGLLIMPAFVFLFIVFLYLLTNVLVVVQG